MPSGAINKGIDMDTRICKRVPAALPAGALYIADA